MAGQINEIIVATGVEIGRLVAIGGGSDSDLWLRILADATGRPVVRSMTREASSLGAAIAAAKGAGWYGTIAEAAAAMVGPAARTFEPDAGNAARYGELRAIHSELWPRLADWNARLASFAESAAP